MRIITNAILFAGLLLGGCLLLGLGAIGCEKEHHRSYYYDSSPQWSGYYYDEGPYWGGYGYGDRHERHEWAEEHEEHEHGEHHRR